MNDVTKPCAIVVNYQSLTVRILSLAIRTFATEQPIDALELNSDLREKALRAWGV